MDAVVQKYLQRYADKLCAELTDFPPILFAHALAIPCFDEDIRFVRRITQTEFAGSEPIFVCLVVNQPYGNHSIANLALLEQLSAWPSLWQSPNLNLRQCPKTRQYWLVVDQTSPGLDPKCGVGLARKIAADLACTLWQRGGINTHWLHCTDADTHLPEHYFSNPGDGFSAAIFAHKHRTAPRDQNLSLATELYEKAMGYYVAGLKWAGSPYGFSSIGSTLAVQFRHYCRVRGFPIRNAAEDFYFLNKLAKVGPLAQRKDIVVEIDSRISHRVPFGTGPAVAKIMAMEAPADNFHYYALPCFYRLKEWVDYLPTLANNIHMGACPLNDFNGPIAEALQALKIDSVLSHIRRQKLNPVRAEKALHDWFDGFKTLKWMRFMERQYYPAEHLLSSIEQAPFAI